MSRLRWAKWALPNPVDPPDSICYIIRVPNEIHHIGAFLGAIQMLASGLAWQDDTSHTARVVAKVWRKIADDLRRQNCDDIGKPGFGLEVDESMNLRISPDNPCIIQCLDCNNNWTDWYNPLSCIPGAVSQPAGQGSLSPGDCKTFDVTLDGNGRWRLPLPVQSGYIITISGAVGGWADGSGTWYCPNGQNYALGGCSSTPVTSGSDPCPLIPHGRLISIEQNGSVCHDSFDGSFTVVSATATNLDFQMNDPSLSDNAGSIAFTVKVCAPVSDCWQVDYDLLTSDSGFTQDPTVTDPEGHWVSGVGWDFTDHTISGGPDWTRGVRIRKLLGGTFVLTRIDMTYNLTRGTHIVNGQQATGIGVAGHNVFYPTADGTGLHNNGTGLSFSTTALDLTVTCDYHTASSVLDGAARITHVHIEGTGSRPAGAVDC